jgi:NIPSNAP
MNQVIEIRSYNLKPGSRAAFHQLFITQAAPMLQRWKVHVVSHGPSLHDEDSYYLIRAYVDLAERQESQDAFYGSDEWRLGPREAILALIESYTTVVLPIDLLPDAIKGLL